MPSSPTQPQVSEDPNCVRTDQSQLGMRARQSEYVASFLMSLILFGATIVSLLTVIWVLKIETVVEAPTEPRVTKVSWSTVATDQNPFAVPSSEEVQHLAEPELVETLAEIEPITDRLSQNAADLSLPTGRHGKVGIDSGVDSELRAERAGDDIVPRFERWQLNFLARSQPEYASLLDSLDVELGVFGGDVQGIDIASGFSVAVQRRVNNAPESERRLYFSWTAMSDNRSRRIKVWEQDFARDAGIKTTGRNLVKFIPLKLENQLAVLELQHATSHNRDSVDQIASTIFELKLQAGRPVIKILEQRYRVPDQ